jgi:hypothetical protein
LKALILFIACSFSILTANAQDWLSGSSGNFVSEALDLATDASGNTVAIGYFSGQMNFNDDAVTSASSFSDIFLIKYDANGQTQWLQRFGGAQADRGHKVATDAAGNIYITGFFSGSMSMGSFNLTAAGSSRDIFTAKLTPAGAVTWARSDGGAGTDIPNAIAVDAAGNVILSGQFDGATTIAGVSFTSQTNPSTGAPGFDLFVAKFGPSGTPVWAKRGFSKQDDNSFALTTDASNNIYMTGQYPDTMTFLGQVYNNQVNNAGFVAKLTPAGDLSWFRKLGAAQTYANAIALNNAGELYITGNFLGTMIVVDNTGTFNLSNPYIKRIFLIKLASSTGNYIWGRAQGSNSDVSSRGLTIDPAQNVYIGGDFRCNFDQYRDSSDTGLWNTVGFRDIFVSKFSPGGTMLWNKQSGGRRDDLCYALANGGNDKPVTAGSYENTLHIPTNIYNLTNPSASPQNVVFNGEPGAFVPWSFYRMNGDISKNVFVGKVHDSTNPDLYYYMPGTPSGVPYDYIPPTLNPQQDTIEFCNTQYLFFDLNADAVVGPQYNFAWSGPNLDPNPYVYIAHTTEMVSVTLSSIDGCYTFEDSIYTIANPSPPLPLMTDDHDFNTASYPYNNIMLCVPDTAVVSYTNVCQGCELDILFFNSPFHEGTAPFEVYDAGDYVVRVTDGNGCTSASVFAVIHDSLIPYDSIVPWILLFEDPDFNDTVAVCEGETMHLLVTDSLTNPTPFFTVYDEPFLTENFISTDVDVMMNVGIHSASFVPQQSGWYTFTYYATIGYDNTCGTDTVKYQVVDSFYIQMNPNPVPQFTLVSDAPLCEGESGYLSISPVIAGATWTGPEILWESADHDSILVEEQGFYQYSGTVDNGTCSVDFAIGDYVLYKLAPPIVMFPEDGLICPNSTSTLTINQPGTYTWIGPDGSTVGTSQTLQVTEGGLYSAEYTDPEGCQFFLEQVQIDEYIIPYIDFSPINVICNQGSVELIPVYNGVAEVFWLPPITAQTNTVTVTQPGVYYAEVTQCGTTITDSVTIYESDFSAQIDASDVNVCVGGQVTLTAQSGQQAYEWNGDFGSNTLVVTEPGTYTVEIVDNLGCESSATVEIGQHPLPQTPSFADIDACQGDDLSLTDNSGLAVGWYADSTQNAITTGATWTLPNVPGDTVIYVAYDQQPCPFNFGTVIISVTDTVAQQVIDGDLTLCEGQELDLSVPYDPTYTYEWTFAGQTVSDTNFISGIVPPYSGTVSVSVTNSCSTETGSVAVLVVPELQLELNITNASVCQDETMTIQAVPDFDGMLYWQNGGDSLAANPLTVSYGQWEDSVFLVYGIDQYGCLSLPTSAILNFYDCNPVAPNVITSNGDGINDYFVIPNVELMPGNYLIVLNRWGAVVYETSDYNNTFDGMDQTDGVYFYRFYRKGRDSDVPAIHGFFHIYH